DVIVKNINTDGHNQGGIGGIAFGGTPGQNHHLLVRNAKVFDVGAPGSTLDHGIYWSGKDSIIENSEVYNSKGHGIHMFTSAPSGPFDVSSNIIRNNKLHDNGSYGLLLSSGDNNVAYNNLIYNNGILLGGGAGGMRFLGGTNNQMYNNTVYGNSGIGIRNISGTQSKIVNNISLNNTVDNITDDVPGAGATINQNLCNTVVTGICAFMSNSTTEFVNATTLDFHLKPMAVSIDKGANLGPPYNV